MLTLNYSGGNSLQGLRGFGLGSLGGSAIVERLQTSLIGYSQATGQANANPGKADGIVGPATVNAVAAVLPAVASTMSGSTGALLQVALTAASFSSTAMAEAKKRVEQYAPQLTTAVELAKVRVVGANNTNSANVTIPNLDLNPSGGAIYAYDVKVGGYRMAKPIGVSGLGAPTYIETGISKVLPTAGSQVTLHTFQVVTGTLPWYETWWGLTSIGVGVLSIGIVTLMAIRK